MTLLRNSILAVRNVPDGTVTPSRRLDCEHIINGALNRLAVERPSIGLGPVLEDALTRRRGKSTARCKGPRNGSYPERKSLLNIKCLHDCHRRSVRATTFSSGIILRNPISRR